MSSASGTSVPHSAAVPPSSGSAPKGRNLKRVRITNMIRERAEKKKALEAVELEKPAVEPADSKEQFTNKNAISLPTSDPRYYYSRHILDAINSCDIVVLEETLRKYCAPDVISSHLYVGELEHNPLGPNTRILVGYDAVLEVWRAWFKIAPDSVFLYSNIRGVLDKKTGTPRVSDEEVRRVEALRERLLSKKHDAVAKIKSNKSAILEQSRNTDDTLLAAVEKNVLQIAQWRHTNGTAKEFLQKTLFKEEHRSGQTSPSNSTTAGGTSKERMATEDEVFGDATEAEIEYLLDSFLDDFDVGSSGNIHNNSAKYDPSADLYSYHPDQPQPLSNPTLLPASSSSSAAVPLSLFDMPATGLTSDEQSILSTSASAGTNSYKPLKPLPKNEIVTYTYHGTFSVEISNVQSMITKMNFSFAINVAKSGEPC